MVKVELRIDQARPLPRSVSRRSGCQCGSHLASAAIYSIPICSHVSHCPVRRPASRSSLQPFYRHHNQLIINSVKLSPTQSNSVQPSPTQSNPVKPSQTQSNPVKPCLLGWRQPVATTPSLPSAPSSMKTSAIPFVIHFGCPSAAHRSARSVRSVRSVGYVQFSQKPLI